METPEPYFGKWRIVKNLIFVRPYPSPLKRQKEHPMKTSRLCYFLSGSLATISATVDFPQRGGIILTFVFAAAVALCACILEENGR